MSLTARKIIVKFVIISVSFVLIQSYGENPLQLSLASFKDGVVGYFFINASALRISFN